jgi:hypothetical protein
VKVVNKKAVKLVLMKEKDVQVVWVLKLYSMVIVLICVPKKLTFLCKTPMELLANVFNVTLFVLSV